MERAMISGINNPNVRFPAKNPCLVQVTATLTKSFRSKTIMVGFKSKSTQAQIPPAFWWTFSGATKHESHIRMGTWSSSVLLEVSTGTRRFHQPEGHFALVLEVCSSREVKLAEPQALNLVPRGSGHSRIATEHRPGPFRSAKNSFEHRCLRVLCWKEGPFSWKLPTKHTSLPQPCDFILNYGLFVACFLIRAIISKTFR